MYFLPWWWAVALPTAAVLLLLLCIGNAQTWNEHEIIFSPTNVMYFQLTQLYPGTFVGVVMIQDSSTKAAKSHPE